MAELHTYYKCRLCGLDYHSGAVTGATGKSRTHMMLVVAGLAKHAFAPDRAPHDCADGSIGVADFQGFKLVGCS